MGLWPKESPKFASKLVSYGMLDVAEFSPIEVGAVVSGGYRDGAGDAGGARSGGKLDKAEVEGLRAMRLRRRLPNVDDEVVVRFVFVLCIGLRRLNTVVLKKIESRKERRKP